MTDTTYDVNISRYFDAPPELVYRAFTDPEQLSQWFGPLMAGTRRRDLHRGRREPAARRLRDRQRLPPDLRTAHA